MDYSNKLEKLNNHLKKYFDEDISLDETRLVMLFIVQKVQFIKLIIDIISPDRKNKDEIALKSTVLYCLDYDMLIKESEKFKKEFGKKELINEILEYIKKSNIFKNKLDIIDAEIEEDDPETFFRMSFIQKKYFFADCENLKDVIEKYKNDSKIHNKLYFNKDKITKKPISFNIVENDWKNINKEQENIYNILKLETVSVE